MLVSDRTALPGRGCQSGIGCQLTPIIKMAKQPLRIKDCRELGSDTLKVEEHDRGRIVRLCSDEQSAFVLDGFDLFDDQFEKIGFSINLRPDMSRENASIACSEV